MKHKGKSKAKADAEAKSKTEEDAPVNPSEIITIPVSGALTDPVAKNRVVRILASKEGRLHWGINAWKFPDKKFHHSTSQPSPDGSAMQSPLIFNEKEKVFEIIFGPFDPADDIKEINYTFSYADGTWGEERIIRLS